MPYRLKHVKGGWKVAEKSGATPFSKKPQSHAKAGRQMKALYAAEKKGR